MVMTEAQVMLGQMFLALALTITGALALVGLATVLYDSLRRRSE